jgi:protein O-GlcNAc transferase
MSRKTRAKPQKTPTLTNHARRAAASFADDDFPAAAKFCRQALKTDPCASDVWHLLAVSLLRVGDLEPALAASIECTRRTPEMADYLNTHALILQRREQLDDAERIWLQLIRRDPAHADALYNLGKLLAARGHYSEAIACFEAALSVRPQWSDAAKNLGIAQLAAGNNLAAEAAFATALKLAPRDPEACINLARLRHEADDFDGAMVFYRMALERQVDAATLIRFALLCPIFCPDAASITNHRQRITANLATLDAELLTVTSPATTIANPAFYFAYHGLNDRELMSELGAVFTQAARPASAHLPVRRPRRPRIAFVSAYFKAHTIGRLYAPLIERLPRHGFDLAVLNVGGHDDAMARRINSAADICVAASLDHDNARRALRELEADVIFYPDVGMDPTTLWLAAERLAPVQSVGWGHPVTTGLATIDYFVSSTLLEPPGAATHYSETLVELPAWPVLYDDPGLPLSTVYSRRDFGFSNDERIHFCPQSLFKFHPDFDGYLAAILR